MALDGIRTEQAFSRVAKVAACNVGRATGGEFSVAGESLVFRKRILGVSSRLPSSLSAQERAMHTGPNYPADRGP